MTLCVLQAYANYLLLICTASCGYICYCPKYSSKTASKMGPSHQNISISLKWPWGFCHLLLHIRSYAVLTILLTEWGWIWFPLQQIRATLRGLSSLLCLWQSTLLPPNSQTEMKKTQGGKKRKGQEKRKCSSYLLHDSSDHCNWKNKSTCYKNVQSPVRWGGGMCSWRFLGWFKRFLFSSSA